MSINKKAIKLLNEAKKNTEIYIPIYEKDKNKQMLKMYKDRLAVIEHLLGLCKEKGRCKYGKR